MKTVFHSLPRWLFDNRCLVISQSHFHSHSQSLDRVIRSQRRPFASVATPPRDGKSRLSTLWAPTGGRVVTELGQSGGRGLRTHAYNYIESNHDILARAGFLWQAHSGVFHLLPLGLRVQKKLESLIDKHMVKLGACKVSLSSITSEELWRRSFRLGDGNGQNPELFRLNSSGRRGTRGLMLSPTHEEEITEIVAKTVKSYKELPLRLYQISRKYRDERRPRQGLLRAREFVMKDLYTFDVNQEQALRTYDTVKSVYVDLFEELKMPYMVAEADSGTMGGNLSHEFHFASPDGEDNIISCETCSYVANEELAERRHETDIVDLADKDNVETWTGMTACHSAVVKVLYPKSSPQISVDIQSNSATNNPNIHAIKRVVPNLDPGSSDNTSELKAEEGHHLERSTPRPSELIYVIDYRLKGMASIMEEKRNEICTNAGVSKLTVVNKDHDGNALDLVAIKSGDACARCEHGKLKVLKAIELGHTFYLGTRYSEPLGARVTVPDILQSSLRERNSIIPISTRADDVVRVENRNGFEEMKNKPPKDTAEGRQTEVHLEMGCHGIGVSRMIGAVASILMDEKGLNWPRAMAPFEAVVVPGIGLEADGEQIYDHLTATSVGTRGIDAILDDRQHNIIWKLKDADLVGYPVLVVLGRAWKQNRHCEVQCRRLDVRKNVPVEALQKHESGKMPGEDIKKNESSYSTKEAVCIFDR